MVEFSIFDSRTCAINLLVPFTIGNIKTFPNIRFEILIKLRVNLFEHSKNNQWIINSNCTILFHEIPYIRMCNSFDSLMCIIIRMMNYLIRLIFRRRQCSLSKCWMLDNCQLATTLDAFINFACFPPLVYPPVARYLDQCFFQILKPKQHFWI